jgi:hypothetical protein
LLIILIFAATLLAGGVAFANLNIEAYPDRVPPMVEIVTQAQGLSAEEIERSVTIPVEMQMAGVPHLATVRAISLSGFRTSRSNSATTPLSKRRSSSLSIASPSCRRWQVVRNRRFHPQA